jgi:hypothetical protein
MTAVSIIVLSYHCTSEMFLFLVYTAQHTVSMGELISKVQWQQSNSVCDGIHFKIFEPSPFSKDWNSHKLGGAALSYELETLSVTIRSATCVLVAKISMRTQGKQENEATTRRITY